MKNIPKIYLDVSFDEKEEAKALGAKWDNDARRWWIPADTDLLPFEPWLPDTDTPKLECCMTPKGAEMNLRDILTSREWFTLQKVVKEENNRSCSVCGYKPVNSKYLHCHEDWEYVEEDGVHIKRLRRLIPICNYCHSAVHYGHAQAINMRNKAFRQLMHINHWDEDTTKAHISEAYKKNRERSEHQWHLDFSHLKQFDFDYETAWQAYNLRKNNTAPTTTPNPKPQTPEDDENEVFDYSYSSYIKYRLERSLRHWIKKAYLLIGVGTLALLLYHIYN